MLQFGGKLVRAEKCLVRDVVQNVPKKYFSMNNGRQTFERYQSPINHFKYETCIMKENRLRFDFIRLLQVDSWCTQINFIRETCSIW